MGPHSGSGSGIWIQIHIPGGPRGVIFLISLELSLGFPWAPLGPRERERSRAPTLWILGFVELLNFGILFLDRLDVWTLCKDFLIE